MKTERDAAIATLREHGVPCDNMSVHVTDMQALQAQNTELRGIIKQMRVELEQLSDWSDHRHSKDTPTANYVRYMEEEVRKMKVENRRLSEQLQQMAAHRKPPTPEAGKRKSRSFTLEDRKSPGPSALQGAGQLQPSPSPSSGTRDVHRQHQSHLIALSDTIASLQREKSQAEALVQQCRGKVQELQSKLKDEQEMVREHN